jgi:hypothetical protein
MSLMELMAVMSANAVLMAAAIAALMAISRADRQFARHLDESQALAPLLDRLFDDIHAARSVRWEEAEQTLYLEGSGKDAPITYRGELNRWVRRLSQQPNAPEGVITSVYRLPKRVQVAVEPAEAAAGELVRIAWRTKPDKSRPDRLPPLPTEIVVAVGRNERLLHP